MIRLLQNPRFLSTLVALIVAAGVGALGTIVRQEDPTITNGVALIVTPFPGASAERVESLVTRTLEEELQTLPRIGLLRSVSRAGISVVTVRLDESLVGSQTAPEFAKLRDAVDDAKARFPAGVLEPVFDTDRFGSFSMIFGLVDETSTVPRSTLQRIARDLQDALRSVPGTDHVSVFGAAKEVVRVEFEPGELAAIGMDARGLAAALQRADAKAASGVVRGAQQSILLEVAGELDELETVRRVPLTAGAGASTLRLDQVARVSRSFVSPVRESASIDGRSGVLVATKLAPGQRFDTWAERVAAKVEGVARQLPAGARLTTVFDQTRYTRARLQDLITNLATGLLLVVGVLFLTLGTRSALVVTCALPLVTLTSLAVLRVMEVPIHQMSVTGLIVALGLLVDNAIVVTDAVRMRRAGGESAASAVTQAIRHLAVPLFASTLTTVLAFLPIVLLPGRVGEFVGTIGLSVIVALVASYAVAFVVVAPLAGWATRPASGAASGPTPLLKRVFAASLDWSLAHPRRSMLCAALVPLLGFGAARGLPKQFFPPADRDQFFIQLYMPESAAIGATEATVARAEAILRRHPAVRSVSWTVGRSAPPFYYNMVQNQDGNAAFAQALVQVASAADVGRLFPLLQEAFDRELLDAQLILRELQQGPPVEAPVELRLYGPELEELRRIGEELRSRLVRAPLIRHSRASLTATSPKLMVELDEAEALLAGLRPRDVAAQLQFALEGVDGGTLIEASEELPVRAQLSPARRASVEALRGLPLTAPSLVQPGLPGPGIPLAALGTLVLEPTLDAISRRDGERVNVLRGYTGAGVFAEEALAQVQSELTSDPVHLPPGYRIEIGGDAAERKDAMANLVASMPTLVLLMLASVALSLNSFRLAGVVFLVALQSMGFGLLSLALFGFPLGFQAIIGLIGLVGVAINAAIVISSALQADRQALRGDPRRIAHIVRTETSRHIVSTTITTFGGFLPLLLSGGGFWPPFAATLAGGVVLSSIGSFYFVPAAFAVLTRRRALGRVVGSEEVPA